MTKDELPGGIVEGARVRIREPDRYIATVKRLGGRLGTVERIFTPHGSNRPLARVAFDYKRGNPPVEIFELPELIVANTEQEGA